MRTNICSFDYKHNFHNFEMLK